jgi:hypothetical protein
MTVSSSIGPTKVASSKKGFTFYSASEFPDLPEMTWLVDDVLPTVGLASVYGPSGVGKSFLCLDLVAAVADSSVWFGHPTQACNVVYIVLEGQAGFRRRVNAWELHHGCPFPDNASFIFDQFVVNTLEHPYKLAKQIEERGGAGLIVIDTLNRASPGADENSSVNMGEIIAGATMLQTQTGGLVLLVHHPGKDITRSLRGHSSLFAALDTVIEVAEDGNVIKWRTAKSKDGESNLAHGFKLIPVEVGKSTSGKVIQSCVVQEVEDYTPSQVGNEPTGANQRISLEAAKQSLLQQKLQIGLEEDWKEGLPFEDLLDQVTDSLAHLDPKHRKSRAKDALNALIRQGYLVTRDGRVDCPSS